jgi:hypothetical protein
MTPEEYEKDLVDRAWALFNRLTDDDDRGVIPDLLYQWGWADVGATELPKFAKREAYEDAVAIIRNAPFHVGGATSGSLADYLEARAKETA